MDVRQHVRLRDVKHLDHQRRDVGDDDLLVDVAHPQAKANQCRELNAANQLDVREVEKYVLPIGRRLAAPQFIDQSVSVAKLEEGKCLIRLGSAMLVSPFHSI